MTSSSQARASVRQQKGKTRVEKMMNICKTSVGVMRKRSVNRQ